MKILNFNVYGLAAAINASGFPKQTEYKNHSNEPTEDKDTVRAMRLAHTEVGSGHDCFLKGIVVVADINYTQYWSMQFQRYHFADIVSSSSKMHKITTMDFYKCCNKFVLPSTIKMMERLITAYNDFDKFAEPNQGVTKIFVAEHPWPFTKEELFQTIMSNCPMGLELHMQIVTNYLQLKTIYKQRKNSDAVRLPDDWGVFCDWIESLPMFKELCL